MPPSISHRLSGVSKHSMEEFMKDMEAAMLALSKFVSTVVEDLKSKTKWIAEVEINLMSKVFAVPKSEDGKTVQQQQDELCEQCAAVIATKLLDLAGHPGFKGNIKAIPVLPSKLMARVQENVSNPNFQPPEEKKKKQKSVVTEALAPKVIAMDAEGRPLTQHETVVTKKQVAVETIPWSTWAQKQTERNDKHMAKLLLMLAMGELYDHATTSIPLALVRKGSVIQALTTRAIEVGELVVPLFFKKQSSMVTAGEGVTVHPKAVCAVVSWAAPLSDAEKDAGMEGSSGSVQVSVHVQPELKLPAKGDNGLDWTTTDAVHPYWFIKRTEKNDTEANAHLIEQDVTHVMACSFKPLASAVAALAPFTNTFSVSLPCIVNMQKIKAGDEVILKWKPPPEKRPCPAPTTNAFDQIAKTFKKQRMAKAKGMGK